VLTALLLQMADLTDAGLLNVLISPAWRTYTLKSCSLTTFVMLLCVQVCWSQEA
jgi:hypothetical protein